MIKFREQIFDQLGNLFYAIAKEHNINPLEFGELKMIMKRDWLADPFHTDRASVSEPAEHIINMIVLLEDQKTNVDEAFRSFSTFYEAHSEQFSAALKERVLATARTIDERFNKSGQVESSQLARLNRLINEPGLLV